MASQTGVLEHEAVGMMWMDLEPVIDGKTKSEREKQVLYTYRHTYRI